MQHSDINALPTPWLKKYYLDLHKENIRLTKMITIDTDEYGQLVEDQINCFNELLNAGNILISRDEPIPIPDCLV